MTEVFGTTLYTPAFDEPSLWSVVPGEVSTEWMLWHSFRTRIGILQAHAVGKQLQAEFESGLTRSALKAADQEPRMIAFSPQFRQAGITHSTLSLRWVLWKHLEADLPLSDAHALGMNTIHKGSQPPPLPETHPMLGG